MNKLFNRKPVIAILRGVRPTEVLEHVGYLVEAGFEVVEVPTNSPQWEKSVELIVTHFPEILVGAGTVVEKEFLPMLANAGGQLVVTPNVDIEIIQQAKITHQFLVCAGFMTPTEAFQAIKAGADCLKLFPAGVLGVDYFRALGAVIGKNIPIVGVGGISVANMCNFFEVGMQGIGVGGELYKQGQSPQDTKEKAALFMRTWSSVLTEY